MKAATLVLGLVLVSSSLARADSTLNMADGTFPVNQSTASAATTAAYLGSYGITISGLTAGTWLELYDSRFSYNANPYGNPGGSAMTTSSNYNVLVQGGSNNNPAQYTLTFATPVTDVSFYRAGSALGAATPEWSVAIFDGATQIASAGQGVNGYYQSAPTLYSFVASAYGHTQITSIQIYSNNHQFAAFSTVAIDDLHFTPTVPEPCCALLLGSGLIALFAMRRRIAGPTAS